MNSEVLTIMKNIQGFSLSVLLYTACEIRLFDNIDEQKQTKSSLAQSLKIPQDKLNLIVTPLIAKRFIKEKAGYLYLTELGDYLTERNSKDSLLPYVLFTGRIVMPTWLGLTDGLTSNQSPYEVLHKQPFFEHLSENEKSLETFTNMMDSYTRSHDLEEWFKHFSPEIPLSFVDIGGGRGELMVKILNYFINSKGVVLDLNSAEEETTALMRGNDVSDRLKFKTQNFFDSYEIKGDIFILSKVLHDWQDEQATNILNNIKGNMKPNSRIWIIEELLPVENDNNVYDKYMDALNIWILCGGVERSYHDFEKLLEKSGLKIERTHHINGTLYLLDISSITTEGII
ncbi:methyltransferase [Mammaliicoccus sciuri]|uniref:methyltransferase n=1 Tax=Mammaliicoccus sciuri TaxID=1296 RepID=UPI0021D21088|nr:methyltransferase [Mammaliicoccus sciuri]UXV29527.1 hypothetical protein MUA76_00520 [Mammaliicoccus sciuri]